MNGIELSQEEIFELFKERMQRVGIEVRINSGTYNNADPTCFENFEGVVALMHGISMEEAEDEDVWCGRAMSVGESIAIEYERIGVTFVDCTWGVEITFKGQDGIVHNAYLDYNCGSSEPARWYRPTKRFFEIYKKLITMGKEWKSEETLRIEGIEASMLANAF